MDYIDFLVFNDLYKYTYIETLQKKQDRLHRKVYRSTVQHKKHLFYTMNI